MTNIGAGFTKHGVPLTAVAKKSKRQEVTVAVVLRKKFLIFCKICCSFIFFPTYQTCYLYPTTIVYFSKHWSMVQPIAISARLKPNLCECRVTNVPSNKCMLWTKNNISPPSCGHGQHNCFACIQKQRNVVLKHCVHVIHVKPTCFFGYEQIYVHHCNEIIFTG